MVFISQTPFEDWPTDSGKRVIWGLPMGLLKCDGVFSSTSWFSLKKTHAGRRGQFGAAPLIPSRFWREVRVTLTLKCLFWSSHVKPVVVLRFCQPKEQSTHNYASTPS